MKAFYLFLGIAVGVILGLGFGPQISEALYSIPPTNAWQTIFINDNVTIPTNNNTSLNATSYRDIMYLVSDGSINITIGTYP